VAQGAPTDSEIAQSIIDELLYVTQNIDTFSEEMTMEAEKTHNERFATPSSILPPSYTAEANGYPALRRTGRLARSLGWGAAGRSADSIRGLSGNTISFGTMRPGAAVQARGGILTAPPGKPFVFRIGDRWFKKYKVTIPARKFLGLFNPLERARVAVVILRVAVYRMQAKMKDVGLKSVTSQGTSSRELARQYWEPQSAAALDSMAAAQKAAGEG